MTVTRRELPPIPKRLMPNGRRPCRGCGGEIPKGRFTWCGNECRDKHYMGLSAFARRRVWERDKGICALCGGKGPWRASKYGEAIESLVGMGHSPEAEAMRELCERVDRAEALAESMGRMLQADIAILKAAADVLTITAESVMRQGDVTTSGPEGA